jgi:hypothetical protein
MPQCPQYIQAEVDSPTFFFFLRQIVASYILQRGVFVLIVSFSSGDLEVTAICWGLLGLCRVFSLLIAIYS